MRREFKHKPPGVSLHPKLQKNWGALNLIRIVWSWINFDDATYLKTWGLWHNPCRPFWEQLCFGIWHLLTAHKDSLCFSLFATSSSRCCRTLSSIVTLWRATLPHRRWSRPLFLVCALQIPSSLWGTDRLAALSRSQESNLPTTINSRMLFITELGWLCRERQKLALTVRLNILTCNLFVFWIFIFL